MLFDKFKSEVAKTLEEYLMKVSYMSNNGKLVYSEHKILYPNLLIFTQCDGYYVAELIGATDKFNGLKVKICKEKSIYKYLSQFDSHMPVGGINIDCAGVSFKCLCFARNADTEKLKERFPSLEFYKSVLHAVDGAGSSVSFGPNFESCVFENCALVNSKSNYYRCKDILTMYIFKSGITHEKLKFTLNYFLSGPEVKCIRSLTEKHREMVAVSGQMQNMYFFPKIHETTIGEFLKLHPDIVMKAFNSERVEYEPYLKWIERDEFCDDTAINPDLLVQRPDGYFDIYDLKTALLTKDSITKGKRNRRRFIDYVSEGIAQLANYEEYFTYTENAAYAKEKYNIEVKNPKLTLVVGYWDNSCQENINQALRAYKNIDIIDYDTLCKLFIKST